MMEQIIMAVGVDFYKGVFIFFAGLRN